MTKTSSIVVHCRSGRRGANVTEKLKSAGYDAVNNEPGFEGWKEKFQHQNTFGEKGRQETFCTTM